MLPQRVFPRRFDMDDNFDRQRAMQEHFARIEEEKAIRERYKVIEKRPQNEIRYIRILHEVGPDGPRVVQVHFRNGNVEEGLQEVVLRERYQRIRAAAIESLRQYPPVLPQ